MCFRDFLMRFHFLLVLLFFMQAQVDDESVSECCVCVGNELTRRDERTMRAATTALMIRRTCVSTTDKNKRETDFSAKRIHLFDTQAPRTCRPP